jgi:hypothetical protein
MAGVGLLLLGSIGGVGALVASHSAAPSAPSPTTAASGGSQDPGAALSVAPLPALDAPVDTRPAPEPVEPAPIELSSVEGAQVERDGEILGSVPLQIERPAPDERLEVTLTRPGYVPRRVVLSNLTDTSLRVPLQRRAPRRVARDHPSSDAHDSAAREPEVASAEPTVAEPQRSVSQRQRFLDPWL